ncbi:MAG: glycoside hydrolase family 5 protein, partial [Lachnospiraceae bacterium]|nr:glycoside hydrolase family 5 protein [Lachnospiraceae bacterium]
TSIQIDAQAKVSVTGKTKQVKYSKTPYGKNGKLKVKGTKLVNKKGKKFQLKGVSTHGINWDVGEPFVNKKSLQNLRDEWGVNCIRVAMYTQDYNGYCVTDDNSRKKLLNTIDVAVKSAKDLGMYVIIDWHVLNDKNPKVYEKEASKFFNKVSKKYKKYGNVLYEICNEPNSGTSWSDIKSYAKKIIKVIRKNNKNAIIIVGTPTWSQDVDVVADNPIKDKKNIMYTVHFYAGTHYDYNLDKVKAAIKKKLPVICTEFSGCEAYGGGKIDKNNLNKWIKYFKKNGIGFCCWSLSNKDESASLLKPDCKKTSGYKYSDLSVMGKWLVNKYNQ